MGDKLTIELTDMAHGGEAVGRHEGRVIFVPAAIAGEQVRVELVQERGNFARARLVDIITPSPARVSPPCPYFGQCGGCHWQHIAYPTQLEFKRGIVAGQLRRIAGLKDVQVQDTVGAADPWGYRNHVQFHATADGVPGFMAASSHDVVPIEQCQIMHPLLQDLYDAMELELPGLRRFSLRAGIHTGERMVVFEMEGDEPPDIEVTLPVSCVLQLADGTAVTLMGSSCLHETLGQYTYRISAPSFFQVNTFQAERLVDYVCAQVSQGVDSVVDAYCGVGTFSLAMASRTRRLVGIEGSPSSLEDARVNAQGLDHLTFLQGAVEDVLPTLDSAPQLMLLDPPRQGLDPGVLAALRQSQPERIIYVSCDPATLARDIKGLLATGYQVRSVAPFDMFPQTFHVETVAVLERLQAPSFSGSALNS